MGDENQCSSQKQEPLSYSTNSATTTIGLHRELKLVLIRWIVVTSIMVKQGGSFKKHHGCDFNYLKLRAGYLNMVCSLLMTGFSWH